MRGEPQSVLAREALGEFSIAAFERLVSEPKARVSEA
jgi:hypothetical protein